jgi:hypothetical protein
VGAGEQHQYSGCAGEWAGERGHGRVRGAYPECDLAASRVDKTFQLILGVSKSLLHATLSNHANSRRCSATRAKRRMELCGVWQR